MKYDEASMANEGLLYIEDINKRKLFYRFTPAAIVSNFVPLLVILHDHKNAELIDFEYKMWNVLRPLDNFGYEKHGSCWLGEKGDFFVKDLLQELIEQVAEEYECEEHIYLYGSGMGGYGAILHGILCKANAVYADTPYIRLEETNGTDTQRNKFYDFIFSKNITKENDLRNFLNPRDSFPIFYLCDKNSSDESRLKAEVACFVQACEKYAIKFDLEHCPKSGNDEDQALKEVLDMLERVAPQL